jgi:hypothetical protein
MVYYRSNLLQVKEEFINESIFHFFYEKYNFVDILYV